MPAEPLSSKPKPSRADPSGLDVSDHLCFAIYSAGHAFTRAYKPLLEALGLTYPQYLVMLALWAKDDQTVGEIGGKLFLESSTLTPLLKRVEALGLLTRQRDDKDERQVRLRLTAKGTALRRKSAEVTACIGAASGLKLEDIIKLRGRIVALRDSLMKAGAV